MCVCVENSVLYCLCFVSMMTFPLFAFVLFMLFLIVSVCVVHVFSCLIVCCSCLQLFHCLLFMSAVVLGHVGDGQREYASLAKDVCRFLLSSTSIESFLPHPWFVVVAIMLKYRSSGKERYHCLFIYSSSSSAFRS